MEGTRRRDDAVLRTLAEVQHARGERAVAISTLEEALGLPDAWRPPAYRIPLPPGSYRVALHFADLWFTEKGQRIFGVRIEGKPVLPSHDLIEAAGFAVADIQTFETRVDDGILDIEFLFLVENPKISAIEVERLK